MNKTFTLGATLLVATMAIFFVGLSSVAYAHTSSSYNGHMPMSYMHNAMHETYEWMDDIHYGDMQNYNDMMNWR